MSPLRIVLVLLSLIVLAAGAGALFFLRAPTTELVDASGARLTAGLPDPAEPGEPGEPGELGEPRPGEAASSGGAAEPPALFAGSLFDEALALMRSGRHAAARDRLRELLESSDRDGETCVLLSRAERELGNADAAADYGLKAVELLPDRAEAHLAYARGLGLQLMQGPRLAALTRVPLWKEELETVIELDPRDIEARSDLAIFYIFVPSFAGGDPEYGLELANEIHAIDVVRGCQFQAMALDQLDRTEEAIEVCREGIAADPPARALQNTLAGFYAKLERFDEADRAYEAAREGRRDEHAYRSLYMQAAMWIDQGRAHEEAIAQLDEFIAARPRGDLMPTVAQAQERKGAALEALGREADALESYRASLRLDASLKKAEEGIERLSAE